MKKFLVSLSLVAILWGCSPARLKEHPSLINHGILPLSTNNPYVAANILLAREAEKSTYLFNFLKNRGAPTAIEIIQDSFGPTRMLFFYPAEKEVYRATLEQSKNFREWLISGPYQISRQDYRTLASYESSLYGEPLFIIWDKPYRFKYKSKQKFAGVLEPDIPPPPKPRPKRKTRAVKKHVSTGQPVEAGVSTSSVTVDWSKLNTDQKAIFLSKGFAERTANGDLIHRVTREDETLAEIAEWYTKSKLNAAKIAAYNKLSPSAALTPGMQIKIPRTLLKRFKVMPGSSPVPLYRAESETTTEHRPSATKNRVHDSHDENSEHHDSHTEHHGHH
ncbi:MAG: LysM domain-containing protein [Candidatus Dadabacteria bacterium]|nr:MAG: LysM domain-containing protein [Candidatus Dadabacteria bacterium]